MKLSARNQLKGKIININQGAVNSIVSIDIGGGNIITANISCAAVKELGLKVGSDAYAVIKADCPGVWEADSGEDPEQEKPVR